LLAAVAVVQELTMLQEVSAAVELEHSQQLLQLTTALQILAEAAVVATHQALVPAVQV
jgi:hypothetical protein